MERLTRRIAEDFATALDHCDYGAARALLAEDCEYVTGESTFRGPAAVVASYREHDAWAKRNIQSIQYESSVRVEADRAIVTFLDLLVHGGATHTYGCEQLMWVEEHGLIVRIEHRELPGQREAVDAFLERVGIKRPRTTSDGTPAEVG